MRRLLGGAVAVAILFSMLRVAAAQDQRLLPHIGWLQGNPSSYGPYEGFRQGLRDLGYVEGKNVVIDVRSAGGRFELMPALARELAALKVNVIYVGGDQGMLAAKQATNTIPIVVIVCDPLDRFVASLARPGGSATGVTCLSADLAGKRLQILKEMVPALSRVAVMYNPKDRNKRGEYEDMQGAAKKLGLSLAAHEVPQDPDGFEPAFARMRADRSQGLVILADSFMNTHEKRIADLALRNRLPAMYGFREFAEAGGLASYGANLYVTQKRAAAYVDKILKGAKPNDLPVEQPTEFELFVNLKTAKALGIAVPQSVLLRADRVIE
jgi:putative ABC transport system substrate-binding protein